MTYNIDNAPYFYDSKIIKIVEEKYNAKYICETCPRVADGWANQAVLLFWQSTPPQPHMSHYFCIGKKYDGTVVIMSGEETAKYPISGAVSDDGDVIYSRYRHDYRVSLDGSVFVDGGRDYTRTNASSKLVTLKIVGDHLEVVTP